jgi:hypothetical protein
LFGCSPRRSLFTFYKIQTIVIHQIPHGAPPRAISDLLEPMAYLALATFCQRIVNAKAFPLDLSKMMHLPRTLDTLHCASADDFNRSISAKGAPTRERVAGRR